MIPPPINRVSDMTNFNNELSLNDLDTVSGGTWMDTVIAVTTAVRVINDISSVLGKAIDGTPPAPCHPKN
jgi:hypothetical protein